MTFLGNLNRIPTIKDSLREHAWKAKLKKQRLTILPALTPYTAL